MLGIDSLLGIVAAIEKLTDIAVDGDVGSPEHGRSALDRESVERSTCEAMIGLCWRTVLSALSQLLAHTTGEALIVQLLKVTLHSPWYMLRAALFMSLTISEHWYLHSP